MRHIRDLLTTSLFLTLLAAGTASGAAVPEGQMIWGLHFSPTPAWFDPAELSSTVASYNTLYALHDAMIRPSPGHPMAPSLAESWSMSPDGLVYEFALRKGVKFHSGESVSGEDVKFSFERYRGVAHKILKDKVAGIEVPDPARVRVRLKQPWPDFMTFYSTTGAGWIVPKRYVEKVGDDGFKKAPIGAGPYRFVSYTPGVELVVEAFDGYWRKMPAVKRLVFKAIPDESTRLAALKRGEVDVAYGMSGALAEELRRTPGLTLKPVAGQVVDWVNFTEQWDAKSPWHDRRVRLAATYAIDRQAMNMAERLGFARITWSLVPPTFEFYWQPPGYGYDPVKARQLLADAGYPSGFDAGDYFCDASLSYMGEPVVNYLNAISIRVKLRPIERAAFQKGWIEKKYRGLVQGGNGSFGNAATRIESLVIGGGTYVYGSYSDIDGLFREQAGELDRKKREAILHHIQQLIHEKVVVAPIWQNVPLNGAGPRVEESGIGLVAGYIYSAPYEDVRLKGK
jgi:peptide/nickel transport system substrate-binding protein